MLDTEGLRSVLPRERTIEDGVKLYRSMAKHWYGRNEHLGVIAFGLSEDIKPKLTAQEKDVAIKTVVDEAMDTETKTLKRNMDATNVIKSKSDFFINELFYRKTKTDCFGNTRSNYLGIRSW